MISDDDATYASAGYWRCDGAVARSGLAVTAIAAADEAMAIAGERAAAEKREAQHAALPPPTEGVPDLF